MGSVRGWMNPLKKVVVKRNGPEIRLDVFTHEQIKEFCFSLEYYTYRQHVEQLRREEVCLLASMVFLQEIADPPEGPGSSIGLHLA